jgi:hypothetical protein
MMNIMLTVGLGSESTVVMCVVADGNVVCNVVLNKQQVEDHIRVLQRHAAVLVAAPAPDDVNTRLIEHSTMN